MRRLPLAAILFVFFVAAAPLCFGQAGATTGEISGTVSDPSGAPIAGASVSATNTGTGLKQSVQTSETGVYRFTLLPLGSYDVETQSSGFAPSKVTGVILNAG